MKRSLILALIALTALSACAKGRGKGNPWGNRDLYDGQYFRVKLSSDRDNRENFVVTVNDARKTLVGARMAAEHRANEHCVAQFGSSDLTWVTPPETEDELLPIVNGDLILEGTCEGWR